MLVGAGRCPVDPRGQLAIAAACCSEEAGTHSPVSHDGLRRDAHAVLSGNSTRVEAWRFRTRSFRLLEIGFVWMFGFLCLRALPSAIAIGIGTCSMEVLEWSGGSTRSASISGILITIRTFSECHGLLQMLMSCGSTYPSRLWCIWKLFTLKFKPMTSHF